MADLTDELNARLDAWIADAKAFLADPQAHDPNRLCDLLAMADDLISAVQDKSIRRA